VKRIHLKIIIICAFGGLFFQQKMTAQSENARWYFGNNAGLDFAGGAPTALGNSAMRANEGTATVQDDAGNLLFYSDGLQIWNAQHQVMSNGNGLLGGSSTSQAALGVPAPGKCKQYYLFYAFQEFSGRGGFYYSVVDMSLNGGLGDITSEKNVVVAQNERFAEALAVAPHQNGKDLWILFHTPGNAYHAYLLTANGLAQQPVVSNVGYRFPAISFGGVTTFDFNANYTKLAVRVARGDGADNPEAAKGFVQVVNFDNATGTLSNPVSLTFSKSFLANTSLNDVEYPFGVCFSPNGNLLYATARTYANLNLPATYGVILQFDLTAADVQASQKVIYHNTTMPITFAQMRVGNDGKIYVAEVNKGFVGRINTPNQVGTASDFQVDAVALAPNTLCRFGLPQRNLLLSEFKQIALDLGKDTTVCGGSMLTLNATLPNATAYKWSNNSTTPSITVNRSGKYAVTVTVGGCGEAKDEIEVTISGNLTVDLGNNITICSGSSVTLDPKIAGATYLWSDGSKQQTLITNKAGKYAVTVTSGSCSAADTVEVLVSSTLKPDLGDKIDICSGNSVTLDPKIAGATYLWSDGSKQQTLTTNKAGKYAVTVTSGSCSAADTVEVNLSLGLKFDLGDKIEVCSDKSVTLDPKITGATYLWNDGSKQQTLTTNKGGKYAVTVTSGSCTATDTVEVILKNCLPLKTDTSEFYVPNAFSPNEDGINDNFRLFWNEKKITQFKSFKMHVYNRWGDYIFFSTDPITGWNGVAMGKAVVNDVFVYYMEIETLEGVKTLLMGDVTVVR
jgi:gliding motility-associated-like protein